MRLAADILLACIALYPVVTAGIWTAGGVLFRLLDERIELETPAGGWPAVTLLIPAYNEEPVIGRCVQRCPATLITRSSRSSSSTTAPPTARAAAATAAAAGDPRRARSSGTPSTAARRSG